MKGDLFSRGVLGQPNNNNNNNSYLEQNIDEKYLKTEISIKITKFENVLTYFNF